MPKHSKKTLKRRSRKNRGKTMRVVKKRGVGRGTSTLSKTAESYFARKPKVVDPEIQLSESDINNILDPFLEYSELPTEEIEKIKMKLRNTRRVKPFGKYDQFYDDRYKAAKNDEDKKLDLYNQAQARLTNYFKYGDSI
jgi:hypothetical protein